MTYSQVTGVVDMDVDDGGVGLVGAHNVQRLHPVPVLVAALPKRLCRVVCSQTTKQTGYKVLLQKHAVCKAL